MSDKFYKKKKIIYLNKNKKLYTNNIVKFCVFAGRKSNINILAPCSIKAFEICLPIKPNPPVIKTFFIIIFSYQRNF